MILRVQNVVWILSCVACLIVFIFVFFPSWKTIFKQSRHLAICQALKLFLIAISTPSRELGRSIEISFGSRQLVDRSSFFLSFYWIVPWQILDSWICQSLFARHLAWHLSRHLYLSRFTGLLFKHESRFPSHFSRSFSQQTYLLTS